MTTQPVILSIAPYRKLGLAVSLDMAPCFTAEARIFEIAFADKAKAKDLFSEFTRAYIYAGKLHAMLKMHVAKATTESRRRRAVILLDLMPEMAKEKGLASSRSPTGAADIREAFFYKDEEFLAIEDSRAALEAAEALLFSKLMAFREAADAVKQMLSPEDRHRPNNAELVPNAFGTDTNPRMMEVPRDEAPPPICVVEGFGTPGHKP